MNIEIANRLVQLRKAQGLSQEGLAEKLGISRQAVSKWERAEASPDTDNLILLARLYGVSLDDLLFTEDPIPRPDSSADPDEAASAGPDEADDPPTSRASKGATVDIGFHGIHVVDGEDEVHIGGGHGIFVHDSEGHTVEVKGGRATVDGRDYDYKAYCKKSFAQTFPFVVLATIVFLVWGFFGEAWGIGGFGYAWLVFLTVPLYHSLVSAITHQNPQHFAYPVLVTLVFLALGLYGGWWHPGWLVFLSIPLYYSVAGAWQHRRPDANDDGEIPAKEPE